MHCEDMLHGFEVTDGHLLAITTDKGSSNFSIRRKLQSTLEDSGIEWPAFWNHIPWMAHIIQLALGAFGSSLGATGRTRSWEAQQCDAQFGENESIDIEKSQRLQKEGNAAINKVSAGRPDLAKRIEKVRTSIYFESPETDFPKAENASCIDYTNTW